MCSKNNSTLHLGSDLYSSISFHIWYERYCNTVKGPTLELEKSELEFYLDH